MLKNFNMFLIQRTIEEISHKVPFLRIYQVDVCYPDLNPLTDPEVIKI